MKITAQQFIDQCRTHAGARYVHQGRTAFGVDCAGLLVLSASELGVPVEDFTAYTRQPNSATFYAYLGKHATRLENLNDRKPGDLLVFEFENNPQHVAVLTQSNPDYLIHSAALFRKVVEHRMDETWKGKLRAVFRPDFYIEE